jgi:hypothetical protein
VTPADLARLLAIITAGCCGEASRHGGLCPYHEGFADGFTAALDGARLAIAEAGLSLGDPGGDGEQGEDGDGGGDDDERGERWPHGSI